MKVLVVILVVLAITSLDAKKKKPSKPAKDACPKATLAAAQKKKFFGKYTVPKSGKLEIEKDN